MTKLTQEMIEEAAQLCIESQGKIVRTISYKAAKLLEEIHKIEPKWDFWEMEWEIYYKAEKLKIITGDLNE